MLITTLITYLWLFIPQETIPVPTDVTIWGGLSLAIIFRVVVVPALIALGVLTDANKKTVGGYLVVLGIVVAGVYTFLTVKETNPLLILTNLAAGGFAGIGAVGLHSTQKNVLEYFKAKSVEK